MMQKEKRTISKILSNSSDGRKIGAKTVDELAHKTVFAPIFTSDEYPMLTVAYSIITQLAPSVLNFIMLIFYLTVILRYSPMLTAVGLLTLAVNVQTARYISEMHTVISEGSGGVSGGQRQRLRIARSIAPKPRILMFDEATSALDNLTQKKVSDSLADLKCTRIVIAHRLSTIRQCDRIIVLEKEKITEDGSYEELIEKNVYFSELVARQRHGDDGGTDRRLL